MKKALALFLFAFSMLADSVTADDKPVTVELDTSEVPHLAKWGQAAKELIVQWHPRISNLLASKGSTPPNKIKLRIQKTDQGVGGTSGTTITISSHWIEKHPDDIGLVFHELVHVVQSYPNGKPWWLTEGIADYMRWGIFEGKKQDWFPRPKEKHGYRKGYRVTAGFLLWLESDKAPGIVKKLNTAMRRGIFSEKMFKAETGSTLDELWNAYTGVE